MDGLVIEESLDEQTLDFYVACNAYCEQLERAIIAAITECIGELHGVDLICRHLGDEGVLVCLRFGVKLPRSCTLVFIKDAGGVFCGFSKDKSRKSELVGNVLSWGLVNFKWVKEWVSQSIAYRQHVLPSVQREMTQISWGASKDVSSFEQIELLGSSFMVSRHKSLPYTVVGSLPFMHYLKLPEPKLLPGARLNLATVLAALNSDMEWS